MQELKYILVDAQSLTELEKKINDRSNFGYVITNTPIVIHTNSKGTTYIQTMSKA